MTSTLKPYPAYKDSGVEWLGKVPAHWEVRRLKTVVDHINEQTSTKNAEDIYIALDVRSLLKHARQFVFQHSFV